MSCSAFCAGVGSGAGRLSLDRETVTLRRGGRQVVTIRRVPAPAPAPAAGATAAPAGPFPPPDEAWVARVAELPAEDQVRAVVAELRRRNPGYEGESRHLVRAGKVDYLQLTSDYLADLTPVRVLDGLTRLQCDTRTHGQGSLLDLTPLRGLPLKELNLYGQGQVRDLTPLTGMPLQGLTLGFTGVDDLSPLKGMALKSLAVTHTGVHDLSPLRGMPLEHLEFGAYGWIQAGDLSPLEGMPLKVLVCNYSRVRDLTPLRGMSLASLFIDQTRVTDLTPLRGLRLEDLRCDDLPGRAEFLRSLPGLRQINGKPADEFRKEAEARRAARGRGSARSTAGSRRSGRWHRTCS